MPIESLDGEYIYIYISYICRQHKQDVALMVRLLPLKIKVLSYSWTATPSTVPPLKVPRRANSDILTNFWKERYDSPLPPFLPSIRGTATLIS